MTDSAYIPIEEHLHLHSDEEGAFDLSLTETEERRLQSYPEPYYHDSTKKRRNGGSFAVAIATVHRVFGYIKVIYNQMTNEAPLHQQEEIAWKGNLSALSPKCTTFNNSLEGLRGIAVMMTVTSHMMLSGPFRESIGSGGVSIFFVLSGFLITGVLMKQQDAKEDEQKGKVKRMYSHLPQFYLDRMVRLTPAVFLMVCGMNYLFKSYKDLNGYAKYIDYYSILTLTNASNLRSFWKPEVAGGPLWNTWSLACEEQFYVFWSLFLPILRLFQPRWRKSIILSLIIILYLVRLWTGMHPGSLYGIDWHYSLFGNMYKMLMGCALRLIDVPRRHLRTRLAYIGLLSIVILLSFSKAVKESKYNTSYAPGWNDSIAAVTTWSDLGVCISTVLIILGVHGENAKIFPLETQALRFVGRISYSLYLWQDPLRTCFGGRQDHNGWGDTAMAFVAAMMSTFLIEEPIRKAYRNYKISREGSQAH